MNGTSFRILVSLVLTSVICISRSGGGQNFQEKTPLVLDPVVTSPAEKAPIHMPDLIGRTLEYATGIWDDDTPPKFVIQGPSQRLDDLVVRQLPAPGTMIVPRLTTIVLTTGDPSALPNAGIQGGMQASGQSTAAVAAATLLRPPYLQNLTDSSAAIVWTTVEDGPSEVRYGENDFAQSCPASSTLFTTPAAAPYGRYYVHEAVVTGLASNIRYQYKIFTNGSDLTPGGSGFLRAALPAGTPFRFAVIGDSGDGSDYQKQVAERLLQVQPDLALHVGDLIYPEASYDYFETHYFQIYPDLLEKVWMAPAIGNHDLTYNNGKSFVDMFSNPTNPSSDPVTRELYYSFDYGDVHFVVLDNYLSYKPGSAQYAWLQNDLASTTRFWKVVIFHVPVYASDKYQQPRDNANEVQYLAPLFEQYHVNVVLNGHYHYYERMKPLLEGQVSTAEAGGVIYVVTGGGGAGLHSVGTGFLNPRTDSKVQAFHLVMFDVSGCSLQLSAVRRVRGPGDAFDPSDVFDSYSINRCGPTAP